MQCSLSMCPFRYPHPPHLLVLPYPPCFYPPFPPPFPPFSLPPISGYFPVQRYPPPHYSKVDSQLPVARKIAATVQSNGSLASGHTSCQKTWEGFPVPEREVSFTSETPRDNPIAIENVPGQEAGSSSMNEESQGDDNRSHASGRRGRRKKRPLTEEERREKRKQKEIEILENCGLSKFFDE